MNGIFDNILGVLALLAGLVIFDIAALRFAADSRATKRQAAHLADDVAVDPGGSRLYKW